MKMSLGSINVTDDFGNTFLIRGEFHRDENNKIVLITDAKTENTTGLPRFPQPSQEMLAMGEPEFARDFTSTKDYMERIRG